MELKSATLAQITTALLLLLLPVGSVAQADDTNDSPLLGAGDAANTSGPGGDASVEVDPATLSAQVNIPLLNLPGRGLPLQLSLNYTGNFLQPQYTNVTLVPWSASFGISATEQAGWRFVAPSTASLTHFAAVYNVVPNPFVPANQGSYFPCKIYGHEFKYTSPAGQVTYFYPASNPPVYDASQHYTVAQAGWFCGAIGAAPMPDSDYLAILGTLGTTFYSADGSGRVMTLTGAATRLSSFTTLPGSIYDQTGAVARVIETDGTYTEFALFDTPLGQNADSTGQAMQILGNGAPMDQTDRFGNRISIGYISPTDVISSSGTTTGTITFTDTVGRSTVVTGVGGSVNPVYWVRYGLPSTITVNGIYSNGTNEVINFQTELLTLQGIPGINATTGQDSYKTSWFGGNSGVNGGLGNYPINSVITNLTTLSEIDLPGGLKWLFNYDRGWGTRAGVAPTPQYASAPSSCTEAVPGNQLYGGSLLTAHCGSAPNCYCEVFSGPCFDLSASLGPTAFCTSSGQCDADSAFYSLNGTPLPTTLCNGDGSTPSGSYSGPCCSYKTGTLGNGIPAMLISDGSIVKVTTPTGASVVFGLAGEGGAPLRSLSGSALTAGAQSRLSYFLDPDQQTLLEEFKLGYVQSKKVYLPSGALELETDYASVVPAPGDAQGSLTEQVTLTYRDAQSNAIKTETHHFTNHKIQFTDDSSSVTDSVSGIELEFNANVYNCVQTTSKWVGNPLSPGVVQGALVEPVGYCLHEETDSQIASEPETASATDYDSSSIIRPLWTPYTQPCVGETANFTCQVASNAVPRPNGQRLYDGGTSGSGTLMRRMTQTYFDAYANSANLIGLVQSGQTFDGSGNLVSSTQTGYDGQPVSAVSSLPQFSPGSAIGLPTSQTAHDPNGLLADISTQTRYNQAGQPVGTTDARASKNEYGDTSTIFYDPVTGCGGAYPTQVVNALNQSATMSYSCGSGKLYQSHDLNGLVTTSYFNDPFLRPTEVDHPDGTSLKYFYDDVNLTRTTETFSSSGAQVTQHVESLDGFGRAVQITDLSPNGDGSTVNRTQHYDALGRMDSDTNVYAKPTQRTFDALNRLLKTTFPNSAVASENYMPSGFAGRTTESIDLYGRTKFVTKDFFGNVTDVTAEDGLHTHYAYDLRNKLRFVTLPNDSSPSRSFTYDGFGRRLNSTLPEESGSETVTVYDPNGNPTQLTTALGYTVSLTYDALNRLTDKGFTGGSVATNPLHMQFDTAANGIGKLASMTQGAISRSITYDAYGRDHQEVLSVGPTSAVAAVTPYPLTFQYNPIGAISELTLPSGQTVNYGYNGVGNIRTAAWSNPAAALTINTYASHGAIQNETYGNNLTEASNYDPNTLFLTNRVTTTSSSATVMSFGYDYHSTPVQCGASNAPFSQAEGVFLNTVTEQVGSLGTRTLAYTYDCLGRLKAASASGAETWSLQYAFDPNYNRISQQGLPAINQNFSFGSTGNNHIAGYTYDSAGNVTNDGKTSYIYDGENRLVSSTSGGVTTTYLYLDSERIVKNTSGVDTHYVRGLNGVLYSEFTSQAPAPGATAVAHYYHRDHLGSTRLVSDENGSLISTHQYYPYGEEENANSADGVSVKFTGHERDTETGNDYMKARYYGSTEGIFLSVDKGQPDITNPQSWNRYVYADNNPLNKVDPTGNGALSAMIQRLSETGDSLKGMFKEWIVPNYNAMSQMMQFGTGLGTGYSGGFQLSANPSNAVQAKTMRDIRAAAQLPGPMAMAEIPEELAATMLPKVKVTNLLKDQLSALMIEDLSPEITARIFQEARVEVQGDPTTLMVIAHGTEDGGIRNNGTYRVGGDEAAAHVTSWAKQKNASCILLWACGSGGGPDPLGQKVADHSGKPVIAPTGNLVAIGEDWNDLSGPMFRYTGHTGSSRWKVFFPSEPGK